MSKREEARKTPSLIELFRQPASRSYFLAGLAALLMYYALMTERAGELATLLTILIAVPGLLARWIVSPPLFLIFSTYLLFDPAFGGITRMLGGYTSPWGYYGRRYRADSIELDDLLLAASILVYLMAQYRLLSLNFKSMPDDPPPRRKGQPEPTTPRRPSQLYSDSEIGRLLAIVPVWVLLGLLAWLGVSGYERGERISTFWGLERPFSRLMLFVWAFATLAMLASVTFRYLSLRAMSRREARLMLQDHFWQETRREQERIHRWRRWYRKAKLHEG